MKQIVDAKQKTIREQTNMLSSLSNVTGKATEEIVEIIHGDGI